MSHVPHNPSLFVIPSEARNPHSSRPSKVQILRYARLCQDVLVMPSGRLCQNVVVPVGARDLQFLA
jgi:hypothetical protein